MSIRSYATLLTSMVLCGCGNNVADPRLNSQWPCGVFELSISEAGESLTATRSPEQQINTPIDLTHLLGLEVDIGRKAHLERRALDLRNLGDQSKSSWKIEAEARPTEAKCQFRYVLPMGARPIANCLSAFSEGHLPQGWSLAAISKIPRPIVVFGRNGKVLLVIEQGAEGQPTAIYRKPGVRIGLFEPDILTTVLPSEDADGQFGFWTDTPFSPTDAQWAYYRFDENDQPVKAGQASEPLKGLTFRRQTGRNYDVLVPEPELQLDGGGGGDDRAKLIRYRKTLVRTNGSISAWLETDNDQTSRIMVQKGQAKPAAVAVCQKHFPQVLYAVPLKGRFGPFRGILAQFDGRSTAPLAIELHGGPHGDRSNPATATFGIESNSDILIRTSGFQKLSLEYPGSGTQGYRFRHKVDFHAQDVGRDSISAAVAWARRQDRQAHPVVFGSSYGAYLGAIAIPTQPDVSAYVLISGIFDPAAEFRRRPGGESGIKPQYLQGESIFDATPIKGPAEAISPLVIVAYGENDKRVYQDNSEDFLKRSSRLGYRTIPLKYDKGDHDTVPFLMMDDPKARSALLSASKSSGAFNVSGRE